MLFDYLMDFLGGFIVGGLVAVALGLFASFILLIYGEKMKWW